MIVRGQFPFTVIGHRGCAGVEPENTLLGVQRAIDMGCPVVEIDVRLLGGRLVVIHDDKVDRTTNGKGLLEGYQLDALRKLDAGKGQKVPFLEEVLEVCAGKCQLNIELKGEGTAGPVVDVLQRNGGVKVVLSSFHWDWLEEAKRLNDHLEVAVLVGKTRLRQAALDKARELGAVSVNPSLKIISKAFCDQAHKENLKVHTYTVKNKQHLQHALASGADGCFADFPQEVLKSL